MELRPIFSTLLRNKTGALLIALQVAISLAILVNALYIVNMRLAVAARPSGVTDEATLFGVYTLPLKKLSHEEQLAQQDLLRNTLKGVPGVQSVAFTNQMPMSRSGNNSGVATDRKQVRTTAQVANYFTPDSVIKTMGLKLVQGRDFLPSEIDEIDPTTSDADGHSVIISQALAQVLYPGAASVVGKPIFLGTGDDASELRIVGVVERLQSTGAQSTPEGEYSMIRGARESFGPAIYVVRTAPGELDRVMRDAEAALQKASPTPITIITKSMEKDRDARYRNDRGLAWMLVTVCVLLLLVTASGIVGMTTLWVSQRRKQIGVRRALGGRRLDIMRYFITENLVISSVGVTLGLMLALGLNQLLVSQLELPRLPAGYMLGGVGIFWALGLVAGYGPSWRAASISPAIATRSA
jgi:putative ABC transport system permease protein